MQEDEIRRIVVLGQPGPKKKKITKPHLNRKKLEVVHMPAISAMGNAKQEDSSPGWPGKKARSYLKNNQSKKDWRL
jgi:hypothetical protein